MWWKWWMLGYPRLFLGQDTGGGGGGNGDDGDATGGDDGDHTGDDADSVDKIEGLTPAQQAHYARILSAQKRKARQAGKTAAKAEADKAREKAEGDAETERLAEQEKYRELAEAHAKTIAGLNEQLVDAQATVQQYGLLGAFRLEVASQKLQFASPIAETDAFDQLIAHYREGIEIDDDGKITGMPDAVKQLKAERPHFFGPAEPPPDIDSQRGRGGGTPPGGPGDKDQKEEAIRQRFRIKRR